MLRRRPRDGDHHRPPNRLAALACDSRVYSAFAEVRPYAIWPGVVAHAVQGEEITLALVELEPDSVVAEHSHPNEQAGFIEICGYHYRTAG